MERKVRKSFWESRNVTILGFVGFILSIISVSINPIVHQYIDQLVFEKGATIDNTENGWLRLNSTVGVNVTGKLQVGGGLGEIKNGTKCAYIQNNGTGAIIGYREC